MRTKLGALLTALLVSAGPALAQSSQASASSGGTGQTAPAQFALSAPSNSSATPSSATAAAPSCQASSAPNPSADSCCLPRCCADTCEGAANRLWAEAEYLLWWTKDGPLPVPLVASGTPESFGTLGMGGVALFGGRPLDYGAASGGRLAVGGWLDDHHTLGIEFGGFLLEQRAVGFSARSDAAGSPVITRPLINALDGTATAQFVAFPDAFAGGIAVTSQSKFWGADVNVLTTVARRSGFEASLLAGFRYLDLSESLTVLQSSQVLEDGIFGFNGQTVLAPNSVAMFDAFRTHNHFYGGQLGGRATFSWERFSADVTAKVALGWTEEVLTIAGSSTLLPPGGTPQTTAGGVLALATNSGHRTHDEFAVVPEVGVKIGYRIIDSLMAYVGYNFLYGSDVVRPGDQIDRRINPTQLPTSLQFTQPPTGPALPAALFHRSDYWAQGITFGVRLAY
jgi:hypothetical protein